MNKQFSRYFGKNIARKLYLVSWALIAIGGAVGYFYWWGYGFPPLVLGVALFFITSAWQVSDKDVDDHVSKDVAEFIDKKVEGRAVGKETLDGRDFNVFYGYIREGSSVRFKAGNGGKIRTSQYYITAISVKRKDCKVFMSVYDLLSNEAEKDFSFYTKGAEEVCFEKVAIEFPKGSNRCKIKALKDGEWQEFDFYLPDDALADRLTAQI